MKLMPLLILLFTTLCLSEPSLEQIVEIVNAEDYTKAGPLIDDYIKTHPQEARAYFIKTLILTSEKNTQRPKK